MSRSLTEEDFAFAAAALGCEAAAVKAVCEVEAPRGGFNPDGTPVTLFEGHKFHKATGGRFDESHPDLSYSSWTRQFYGKTWQQEKDRLSRAAELDRAAALESASWGRFQIMGYHWKALGYLSVQDFVNQMYRSEGAQLLAFVKFVQVNGLARHLRARNWAAFALAYNGAGYAQNKYDTKMAAAYTRFSR